MKESRYLVYPVVYTETQITHCGWVLLECVQAYVLNGEQWWYQSCQGSDRD